MTEPHVLVVGERDGYRVFSLECPGPVDGCRSYRECDCPESTISEQWEDLTWFEWADEEVAHGVEHREIHGEWMVPTDNCFLQVSGYVPDVASDLRDEQGEPLKPGRYPVTHNYLDHDEDFFDLILVKGLSDV